LCYKFELAIKLNYIDDAYVILKKLEENHINQYYDDNENTSTKNLTNYEIKLKYKQLGDLALKHGRISLTREIYEKTDDFSGLLLLASCLSDIDLLNNVAINSEKKLQYNISFISYFQLNNLDKCIDVLIKSEKYAEAIFFARS